MNVFKQYCSQKLVDLLEGETNDIEMEEEDEDDRYFMRQEKRMKEKMMGI